MNEEPSLEDHIIDLAKQLRAAYFKGVLFPPWDDCSNTVQEAWLRVANEAFKWLVG